jgi:hypothetical protein
MLATKMSGTIFIRESTLLPVGLAIASEAFLPGWRVVQNLDRYALARRIESSNWNFFYLAGELQVTVLGRDRPGTLRTAVKCVLGKQEGQKFNSLEITKAVSKRFLGIPFVSVTAHARHIQEGIGLVPAKDFVLTTSIAAAPKAGLDSGELQRHGEVAVKQYTALISSS